MKRKFKLTLLHKTLLATSTIFVATGITIGSMLEYAKNSDEVKGSFSAIDKSLFKNDYSLIRDNKGLLEAKISIVDPLKQKSVGGMSEDGSQYWFLSNPDQKMNFTEFFNAYYSKYQESFTQQVTYGSFNFYNEYVLAVKPEKFLEFTKWFINNVAWGPDLLTLDSFRIVPGVERHGNSIVLGNHSTIHKESSEIKFFPDAFFGVAPIFSNISGEGNSKDSLTEELFSGPVQKYQADGVLKNLVNISIIKNAKTLLDSKGDALYANENLRSFKNVFFVGKLKGQKIKLLINKGNIEAFKKYDKRLKEYDKSKKRAGNLPKPETPQFETLVFPVNVTEQEFNDKLKEFGDKYKDYSYSDLVEYTITQARTGTEQGAEDNDSEKATYLSLNVKNDDQELSIPFFDSVSSPAQYYAEQVFGQMVSSSFKNFLDFYDMDQYLGKTVYLYQDPQANIKTFYSSSIQARNDVSNFDESKLSQLTVAGFEVANKVLSITFQDQNSAQVVEKFDATETDKNFELFDSFKYAIGYSGALVPRVLTSTPENLNEKDKEGKPLSGLDSRKFQIYTDAYNGLLDQLGKKFPFLMKKQSGPHLVKTIDENGIYNYEIKDGDYSAFSIDSNIGIPLILANGIKNFQGISTDFLKYVGAHEYGHHYTLEKSTAIDEKDSAVLVGGINVRAGANESSYYSYKALENYIKARTNLLVRRVDALGHPNEKGTFTQFAYIKNDGTHTRWETYEDVWGSKSKDILDTIKNPDRRFIQTFDGLKQSAQKRSIRLGDLFLANSLDSNSATLNPLIFGTGKAIVTENEKPIFRTVSLTEMLSQFKDGLGNSLEFTGTNPNDIKIKFFDQKTDQNGKTIITKFKVFNKDGSPVIKVPLNKPLNDQDLEYLNTKTEAITKNILSLYNLNDFDSGWNSPTSSVSGKPSLFWNNLFQDPIKPKSFFESILYRSDDEEKEFDPNLNGIPWTPGDPLKHINKDRKSNLYYAIDSKTSNYDVINEMLLMQGINAKERKGKNFSGFSSRIFYSTKVFSIVDKAKNEKHNYVFPPGWTYGISKHALSATTFTRYFQRVYRRDIHNSGLQDTIPSLVSNGFGIDGGDTSAKIDLAHSWTNFVGLDASNKLVVDYSKPHNITKIGYNYFSIEYQNLPQTKLDKAIADSVTQVQVNGKSLPMFDNFEQLMEFGSVDYSKATYSGDDKTEAYNWDIDYVKTKFNLDKLRAQIETEPKTFSRDDILASEQTLANEAMKRFIHSSLFMSIKEFKLKDLDKYKAIFSTDYGMDFFSSAFNKNYVKTTTPLKGLKFNAKRFVELLPTLLASYFEILEPGKYPANSVQKAFNNISLNDLFVLLGSTIFIESSNDEYLLSKYLIAEMTDGNPTRDAQVYFATKTEPQLADKFTDYVYTMPETLTRDYVQTTFIPSNQDFGNLPSYLSNVNERNTGLDFINDVSALEVWKKRTHKKQDVVTALLFSLEKSINPEKYFAERAKIQQKFQDLSQEIEDKIQEHIKTKPEWESATQDQKDEYTLKLNNLQTEKNAFDIEKNKELSALEKRYSYDINQGSLVLQSSIDSSYFGKLEAKNNGYFKDRWEKETIGINLYDPTTGEAIHDDTIRLLDLNGQKITSRPRAFFLSQLYNYGVGDRTVSGVYRNKKFDAVSLYGYVKNEDALKIKQLKFTNINTGESKYLDVNIAKTNNIFYLKKQGDTSPENKVTLADEGYSTWISDYALMGKYRDALLFPGNAYTIDFVDKDKNVLTDANGKSLFTLGSGLSLSENGKDQDNAPIKITAKGLDKNNKEIDKATIYVDLQFNVIN
ncbi:MULTISPECIES: PDxFFG protein [unclassified Mycoplasma]|uniref:PDxFFG protein n=1 Tax=unclassified Mycoplasma TaxID=2683645 RepID=UPI00211C3191|nr:MULTISPECIES: PDxFFG protein [unclassified Mycoplasma]UUM19615.1 PDxFFG protein [Mycoplasma sp. 1578d]UUM24585.1 PDxFFG protein [Mycoplasma sp. 3686d]